MLELTNVTAGYGSITALHGVTLRVEKGSMMNLRPHIMAETY